MPRLMSYRNIIAAITMAVAALCGSGKAAAASEDLLSAAGIQNHPVQHPEAGAPKVRSDRQIDIASAAEIRRETVTGDRTAVDREEGTCALFRLSISKCVGPFDAQHHTGGYFYGPFTRAPPEQG